MSSEGEKQFAPTQKKLTNARQRGQVAKSRYLSAANTPLIVLIALALWPNYLWLLNKILSLPLEHGEGFITNNMLVLLYEEAFLIGLALFAPLGLVLVAALVTEILQCGVNFSWSVLAFRGSRLSLVAGLRRIAGWRTEKGGFPLGTIGECLWLASCFLILFVVLLTDLRTMALSCLLARVERDVAVWADLLEGVWLVCFHFLLVALTLGLLDYLYAKFKLRRSLMMDRQELKKEMRESEGDPELRSMRKHLHQELTQRSELQSLRRADVLVFGNPSGVAG